MYRAKLTRGSEVLSNWLKLQGRIHSLLIVPSLTLSCEWSYLQRVIEGYDEEYFRLRDAIQHVFTPAVLGREVLEREHELFTLPVKLGGLALTDPMKSASSAFSISKEATSVLQEAIQTGEEINIAEHTTKCRATVGNAIKKKEEAQNQLSSQLLLELPAVQRRTLHRIVKVVHLGG